MGRRLNDDMFQFLSTTQFVEKLKHVAMTSFDGCILLANTDLVILSAVWGGYPRQTAAKLRTALSNTFDMTDERNVTLGDNQHRMTMYRVHTVAAHSNLSTTFHASKSGRFLFNQLGVISDHDRLNSSGQGQEASAQEQVGIFADSQESADPVLQHA